MDAFSQNPQQQGLLSGGPQPPVPPMEPEELLRRSAALGKAGFVNVLGKFDPKLAEEFISGDTTRQDKAILGLQGGRDVQEILKEFRAVTDPVKPSAPLTELKSLIEDGVSDESDIRKAQSEGRISKTEAEELVKHMNRPVIKKLRKINARKADEGFFDISDEEAQATRGQRTDSDRLNEVAGEFSPEELTALRSFLGTK